MTPQYIRPRAPRNISEVITAPSPQIQQTPYTIAGKYLCDRFLVRSELADLLACFAGLGIEEARQ